jgi:hypothetical protein
VRLSSISGGLWLFVCGVALAASNEAPLDLEWVAPPQCPNRSAVLREVSRIVGDQPRGPRTAARTKVWRGEHARWNAAISANGDPSATRNLEADSCQAIANAAALILALLLNAPRQSEAEAPSVAAENARSSSPAEGAGATISASGAHPIAAGPAELMPPRPAAGGVPPSTGPHAASASTGVEVGPRLQSVTRESGFEPRGTTTHWAVAVLGGLSVGSLPAAQPQAELSIAWLREPLRIDAAVRSDWSSQHVVLPSRANEGADFKLRSSLARGCHSLVNARLSLGACAVFELDWLSASGFGANRSIGGDALIPALGAAATATYDMGDRIALRLLLDASAPLSRPKFLMVGVAASAVVDRPAAAWGRALLGAEARFF